MSALLFELCPRRILVLLSSEQTIEEARVNLQLKKPSAIDSFERLVTLLEVVTTPARHPFELELPEDDLAVFAAGVAGRATHLITGDKKHFSKYFNRSARTGGVHIQTVRQFLDERF